MSSNGKTAIVTGAGSGVGRASALALLAEGYNVVLAGRRPEALEETAARSQQAGLPGGALAMPTDVADETSVRSLFEATKRAFGRLDLLFNNAGTGARRYSALGTYVINVVIRDAAGQPVIAASRMHVIPS